MPKLEALKKQIKRAKTGPPKPAADPEKVLEQQLREERADRDAALGKMLAEIERGNQERHEAMLEQLRELVKDDPTVKIVGVDELGAVIVEKLDSMPPPVVNIAAREPVAYRAKFQYNSRGDIASADIHPIEQAEQASDGAS